MAIGINISGLDFDLSKMMAAKDTAVDQLTGGIEYLFKKNGVDYVQAHGRLSGPNQVECDLVEGGQKTINAKRIMIAVGSEVAPFPGGNIEVDEKTVR